MVDNNKITSAIIFIGICFVLIFVPLMFTTYTQNIVLVKPTSLQLSISFLFFIFLINSCINRKFELSDNPLALPILGLLIVGVVSTIIHPFKNYGLEEMARFVSYFLMVFLIGKSVTSRKRVKIVIWIIFGVLVLSTLYAILQLDYVQMDPVNWGGQKPFVSFYGNKNFFAGFLVTVIPILFALIFTRKYIADIIIFVIIGVAAIYTVLYSGTRGAVFLGIPASLFFFILVQIAFGKFRVILQKNIVLPLLTAIGVLFIIFLLIFFTMPHMYKRFTSMFQSDYGTNLVRFRMWTGAFRMLCEKPILGQGVGTFQLTFPRFRPSMYHRSGVSHNTRHAHSEYMELLSETGLTGLVVFIWILVTFFYQCYKFLIRSKDFFLRQMLMGCIAGIIAALSHNLVSVNLRWTSSGFIFWFILGLSMAIINVGSKSEDEEILAAKRKAKKRKIINKQSINIFIMPLIIVLIIIYTVYFFRLKTIWRADRLLKLGMGEIEFAQRSDIGAARQKQMWTQAKLHLIESIDLNDNEMSSLYKLGYVLLRNGELINALNVYSAIIHNLAPNYAQIHNNIGLLYRQIGSQEKLLKVVLKNGYFLDALIRRELLDKFPLKKQLEILKRVFNYKSIIQFEWATTLENNQKNQGNMAQLYYQQKKYGNALNHFNTLKRVCMDELQKYYMYCINERRKSDDKSFAEKASAEKWSSDMRKYALTRFSKNFNQLKQTLNQMGVIYINNIKLPKFAFEYFYKPVNLKLNDLQAYWKLGSFVFNNKNDTMLENMLEFRLSLIDRKNLQPHDKPLLEQMIGQINHVLSKKKGKEQVRFNFLAAKINHYLNRKDEVKKLLDKVLKEEPDHQNAKELLKMIDKGKK